MFRVFTALLIFLMSYILSKFPQDENLLITLNLDLRVAVTVMAERPSSITTEF